MVHQGKAKPAQPPTSVCISWRDVLHICLLSLLELPLPRSHGAWAAFTWPLLSAGCRTQARTSPGLLEVFYFTGAECGTCNQYWVSSERNGSDFLLLQKVVRWLWRYFAFKLLINEVIRSYTATVNKYTNKIPGGIWLNLFISLLDLSC